MTQPSRSVLLLAGGKSSRMGTPKGLLNYQGKPWLIEQLGRLKAVEVTHVVLILGYCIKEYFSEIPELYGAVSSQIEFQGMLLSVGINDFPQFGPFSSIVQGITLLNSRNEFRREVFILPIDVPCPRLTVWEQLRQNLQSETEVVIPSFLEKGGHPVLLAHTFQEKLIQVPLESPQARLDFQVQMTDAHQVRYIDVADHQIHMNLNTPEDWNRFNF